MYGFSHVILIQINEYSVIEAFYLVGMFMPFCKYFAFHLQDIKKKQKKTMSRVFFFFFFFFFFVISGRCHNDLHDTTQENSYTMQSSSQIQTFDYLYLTHLSLVSFLCDIGKQYSPRCDAAKWDIPSGATLNSPN